MQQPETNLESSFFRIKTRTDQGEDNAETHCIQLSHHHHGRSCNLLPEEAGERCGCCELVKNVDNDEHLSELVEERGEMILMRVVRGRRHTRGG